MKIYPDPYDLLINMLPPSFERNTAQGDDLLYMTYRLDQHYFISKLDNIESVALPSDMQYISGLKPWVLGSCVIQGHVTFVYDLSAFCHERHLSLSDESRLIILEPSMALVIDACYGIQTFSEDMAVSDPLIDVPEGYHSFVEGAFYEPTTQTTWVALDLKQLIQWPVFRRIGV